MWKIVSLLAIHIRDSCVYMMESLVFEATDIGQSRLSL